MNVESKTVREAVGEYLKFGWRHTEDTSVRVGRLSQTHHVLVRNKDMPNYRLIAALEKKYFNLKSQKRQDVSIDGTTCLLCFLIFIIPGIIYLAVINAQKKSVLEHNTKIQAQMNAVLAEVKPLF